MLNIIFRCNKTRYCYYVASLCFVLMAGVSFSQQEIDVNSINGKSYHMITEVSYCTFESWSQIKDIMKEGQSSFAKVSENKPLNFGFIDKNICLKFRIINNDSVPRYSKMILGNFLVYEAELFSKNKNNVIRSYGKTGRRISINKRPYNSNYYTYPLTSEPNSKTTYYLFLDAKGINLQMMLLLFSDEAYQKIQKNIYFSFGLMAGILLLTSLFNLFLYLNNKEKIHLAYSIYSISIIILILVNEGFDYLFFMSDKPYWASRSTITCISLLLFLWVMQLFMNQNASNSRFYRFVNLTKILCIIFPLCGFILSRFQVPYILSKAYIQAYSLIVIWTFFLVICSSFEKLKQGYKLAIFYLIATSLVVFGGSLIAFRMITSHYYLAMPPNILQISLVAEALIICFGILYRYIVYKKEKDLLMSVLQKQQLEHSDKLLAIQETERKRIAEDLHDELGSSLAALKLRLQKSKLDEDELTGILNVVDKASEDTRNISHNLMPPEFEKTSLYDILSNYYAKLSNESGIRFHFHGSGGDHYFSKEDELVVYRILMELTENILKHSGASEATIQLIYYETELEIMTEDNGKGIMPKETNGIGLKNVQSRVNYLNGQIRIDSGQSGTTIMIKVPYKTK